ncbi:MAG: 16S rRNA (guanine(527)-N(7))-methyltransferase RsmG [Dehalococcoidia bacterium]
MPDTSPHPEPAYDLAPLLADAERLGVALDAPAAEAFRRYLALLLEWNERVGLTSLADPAEMQRRHFGESLALLAALRDAGIAPPGPTTRVADLGPGGGFPGVPMRIAEPALRLTLIESHQRRAEFLRTLAAALALDAVEVQPERAEDAGRDPALRASFDLVVARALAPLPVLVEYALPLLRPGGTLAAPKGSRAQDDLDAARGAIEALGGVALEPLALPVPAGEPPQTVLLVRREGDLDDRYPRRPGMPSKRPLT